MSQVDSVLPGGDKMKKAIRWISETVSNNPEKSRTAILHEAEIRFDLSPKECEFINSNLAGAGPREMSGC